MIYADFLDIPGIKPRGNNGLWICWEKPNGGIYDSPKSDIWSSIEIYLKISERIY
jgi:hypothetical protein